MGVVSVCCQNVDTVHKICAAGSGHAETKLLLTFMFHCEEIKKTLYSVMFLNYFQYNYG